MNKGIINSIVRITLMISGIIVMSTLLTACSGLEKTLFTENEQPDVDSQGSAPILTLDPQGSTDVVIITDDQGVPMAFVPAGPFEMGSNDGDDDERPVHTVILDAYYIDQFEVTNGQYAICEDAGVCDSTTDTTAFESSYSRRVYYGNPLYADFPVLFANWNEAKSYCEWRGARLPTEAEWEKAARGRLVGKNYPWGNEAPVCEVGAKNGAKFDDDADCNDNDTTHVGSYSPNGYGLYDMAGNVWEWVSDFYAEEYYVNSPAANPTGPEDGSYRVVRGGSWNNHPDLLRVSDRRYNDPQSGALYSGFRCARDVVP